MSTMLGMPQVPGSGRPEEGPVVFADGSHHFRAVEGVDVTGLAQGAPAPLSVILQVTKRCNFDCIH
jgi:hypothetical protein